MSSGPGLENFLQSVEAAVPSAIMVVAKFGRREDGVGQEYLGGTAASKELHRDERVFAARMKVFAVRRVFRPVPGEDDLLGRRHLAVGALAPIYLVFCRVMDFHAPAAAGANVLL